jgi:tetratricopeptide (TPR) repeat protein
MQVPRDVRLPILLLLLACSLGSNFAFSRGPPNPVIVDPSLPPLPGENSVSNLVVAQGRFGEWTADFDYFFTGDTGFSGDTAYAQVMLALTPENALNEGIFASPLGWAERGAHHISVWIDYPGGRPQRTIAVTASLLGGMLRSGLPVSAATARPVIASREVTKQIDWADLETWARSSYLSSHSVEESLKKSSALIDNGTEWEARQARGYLEALIADNPRLDGAYVQLARLSKNTDGGPAGLHQAEELLQSALQINPQSADAKILLGSVYTSQKKYVKAEALFADAATLNTNNLWLWSDWGELFVLEGKPAEAIGKYREAITRPMTHDSYDRARVFAYRELIDLLKVRADLDGMEALYRQQIQEFGPGSCYSAGYSRFLLYDRGDAQAAIDLSTRALNQNCNDSESRELLGLAQYVKWASTAGPQSEQALNQAHLFLPAGPRAFYGLARSERSLAAARKLIAAGEPIDQVDNDQMTALAYALQGHDVEAARRLLKLGASPEATVGVAQMPVALLPVAEADIEEIRLLRENGVNFSQIRFQGVSAVDLAKRIGNPTLVDALAGGRAPL